MITNLLNMSTSMNDYIEKFWILKNNEPLSYYSIPFEEYSALLEESEVITEENLTLYEIKGRGIMRKTEQDIIIYKSIQDLRTIKKIGIQSSSVYSIYNISGNNFLENRFSYIKLMQENFHLDADKLNYSKESIIYLQDFLDKQLKNNKYKLEKCFLGLLAYSGEVYLNNHKSYTWFIRYIDGKKYSWYPLLKNDTGEIWDVFQDFHENLFEQIKCPTITFLESDDFYYNQDLKDYFLEYLNSKENQFNFDAKSNITRVGKNVINNFVNILKVEKLLEARLPNLFEAFYYQQADKVLLIRKGKTDGLLFQSKKEFYNIFKDEAFK